MIEAILVLPTGSAPLSRCLTVWVTVTLLAGGLTAGMRAPLTAAARTLMSAGPSPAFDQLLVWSCAALSVVAITWLWLVATAVVAGAARGRQVVVPGLPDPVRRLLLAGCGIAVVGGLTAGLHTSAAATPGHLHHDLEPRPATAALAGLPFPDRATTAAPGGALVRTGPVVAAPTPPEQGVAVVHPGETLWAIASRDLGPGASNTEITRHWQQIYRLNRHQIGSDPDVIQPAQRLRLPDS